MFLDVGYKCVSTVVVFEDLLDKGLVISSHFRDGGSAHWATTRFVGCLGELFNTFIAEFVVAIEGDRLLFFIGAITNCAFLWFCYCCGFGFCCGWFLSSYDNDVPETFR